MAIRRWHVISLDYCGYPAWSKCDYPRSSRLEHSCTQRCQIKIYITHNLMLIVLRLQTPRPGFLNLEIKERFG